MLREEQFLNLLSSPSQRTWTCCWESFKYALKLEDNEVVGCERMFLDYLNTKNVISGSFH